MSRFAQKNAAEDASPSLYHRWAVVRDALPIQARATCGRRIDAKMRPAVIRHTGVDGPARKLARAVANDLTARSRTKKPVLVTGKEDPISC
jgi:hypothetical protein